MRSIPELREADPRVPPPPPGASHYRAEVPAVFRSSVLCLLLVLIGPEASAGPPEDLDVGREALATGDLEAAEAAFKTASKRRKSRDAATAGLLSIAVARADDDAVRLLLRGLSPRKASEELILAAGAGELALLQPSGQALAWTEASCALEARQWPDDVDALCTMAPLLRAAPERSRCTAGCEQPLVLPFSYAGSQPVVLASVNGGPPVPLLVDTGASSSLLTEGAARDLGLARREDTALQIGATGGMIPSWRDLVSLQLGEARLEDVVVVVADLPIAGLAGILSPQAAWPGHVVELDFVRHELRVAPAGGQALAGVTLPYRQHGERPYVELRAADRPLRSVVIDTGAAHTQIDASWEQLGAPLKRGEAGHAEGAGGARAEIIPTEGLLEASAGPLPLPLRDPTLYTPHGTEAPGVRNHGLIGADVWMGRVLSIDRSGRRLALTDPPTLPAWRPGDEATFSVSIDGTAAGHFTERVMARDEQSVTLEVSMEAVGEAPQADRFALRTPDTWPSRGSWMLTRAALEAWTVDEAGEKTPIADGLTSHWLPLFRSFGTVASDSPPKLVFGPHRVGDRDLSCTRLELPAAAGGVPAIFSMIECPADPWRVVELGLVAADDGRSLWQVRRQ